MGECQSVKEATDLNDCPQSAQDWNLFNYISLNVLDFYILDCDWINVPNLAKINAIMCQLDLHCKTELKQIYQAY